jgi:hypothetical protein
MLKVKCKKQFGIWYYEKIQSDDLDAPIYELYDDKKRFVNTFVCYNDMKYYIETGEIL